MGGPIKFSSIRHFATNARHRRVNAQRSFFNSLALGSESSISAIALSTAWRRRFALLIDGSKSLMFWMADGRKLGSRIWRTMASRTADTG